MMHIHWHKVVRKGRNGNAYTQCRCGSREIHHPDKTQPLDYRWVETGVFSEMPTQGPSGSAKNAMTK